MGLIITSLLAAASIAHSATVHLQPDCDIAGPAYLSETTENAEECQQRCRREAKCSSFVFVSGWKHCMLKEKIGKIVPLTITAGQKQADGSFKTLPRHDIRGHDLRQMPAQHTQACIEHCQKEPRCLGFAFLDGYQTCWLKDQLHAKQPHPKVFSCGQRTEAKD